MFSFKVLTKGQDVWRHWVILRKALGWKKLDSNPVLCEPAVWPEGSLAEFHFPIHEIKQVVHLTSTPLRF